MPARRPGWPIAVGTVIVSSLVGVAAVEVAYRRFKPFRPAGILWSYQYDPETGYRPKAGIHMLQTTDHQEEVRTNRLGTLNFQESFADYPALVFALGDSFTVGTGAPADASYPAQLDLLLNRDANGLYCKRYGVVNLGLSPSGGEQAWIRLRQYTATLGKPAVVLYLGCENDFADDLVFRSGARHWSPVEGNPRFGWWLPLRQLLNRFDITQRLLYMGREMREERLVRQATGAARVEQTNRPVAALQEPVLEKIAAATRDQGARLVVGWAQRTLSYDYLREWAKRRGAGFADWRPAVESVQEAMPALPLENPHSGGHYRAWVNRLIAEAYAREITGPPSP